MENIPRRISPEKILSLVPDMVCCIDKHGRFVHVGGAVKEILGYESKDMEGRPYIDFVLQADRCNSLDEAKRVMAGQEAIGFENRYTCKTGEAKKIAWSAVWSKADSLMFCTARQVCPHQEVENAQTWLSAIFEESPDAVFFENCQGVVTYANRVSRELFQLSKTHPIQTTASSFLPADMASANTSYLQETLRGYTMRFDIILNCPPKKRKVLDATKSPVSVNGILIGAQTIAKDITPVVELLSTTEQQTKRLNTIFESITDAFFTLDKGMRYTNVNKEFLRIAGGTSEDYLGKHILEVTKNGSTGVFYKNYLHALQTKESVHFEGYSERFQKWLEVKAFPSEEGLSVYFNDISEQVDARMELEKLSLVASHTTNGVIISDNQRRIEWVNEGFTKLTGYTLQEAKGKKPIDLLCSDQTDVEAYYKNQSKILAGEAVAYEIVNRKKNGIDIWLSVQVNPILNKNGQVERTVSIQTDITELLQSRKELAKLSLVARHSTNGVIITDEKQHIEWVNEGFTQLTGYQSEEVAGKPAVELFFDKNSQADEYNRIKEKLTQGIPVSFETLAPRKDKRELWLSVQINPVLDAEGKPYKFIVIQKDITDLMQSRRELEKLSLVASKASNSILIADKDWKIEWVNEGFVRLTGYTFEDATGKKPSELLHNNNTNKDSYNQQESKLLSGQPISLEVLNVRKSGEEIWVNVEITPVLNEEGKINRFVEVQTDITSLKKTEQELSDLAKDLYRQNSDLQQFTYIVSHNLRAPVANIMGLTELLTGIDKNSETFNQSLCYLNQVAMRLDSVLHDMNTILSIRDSKETLAREQVEIKPVIQQAIAFFQESIQETGAQISINLKEGLSIVANKAYLYSIFYNLFSNALKYRAENRPLKINIRSIGNIDSGVLLSFSDNGSGFDDNWANHNLFKMYKRFHQEKEGRGMGLYLVKNHIEAMGGHIEASSQVGVGTKFIIYFK